MWVPSIRAVESLELLVFMGVVYSLHITGTILASHRSNATISGSEEGTHWLDKPM